MSGVRKLPRLADMIGKDDAPKPKRLVAQDGRTIVYGEPLPLDRSNIVWPTRRPSGLAQDGKPVRWVYGETHPIAD